MKKKIIGYGSLLNPDGWNKTLSREIQINDIEYVNIIDHVRTWTAFVDVEVNGNKIEACFLDLSKELGRYVSGSAVEVNDEEFNEIAIREQNYDMIDVTDYLIEKEAGFRYFTAIAPSKEPREKEKAYVLKGYLDIVDNALKDLDLSITNLYEATTKKPEYPIIEGKYKFLNEEINKRTGR